MVNLINVSAGRQVQNGASYTITDRSRMTATSATNTAESVMLSPEVTAAPVALQAGPPIDTARVASLREGIANGSYKIDPERIANAIASNLFEISR